MAVAKGQRLLIIHITELSVFLVSEANTMTVTKIQQYLHGALQLCSAPYAVINFVAVVLGIAYVDTTYYSRLAFLEPATLKFTQL